MLLSDEDLETAQFLIDDSPPGIYEIEDIHGEFYSAIERPKFFGKLFKSRCGREARADSAERHRHQHQALAL